MTDTTAPESASSTITIDGKTFATDQLNENAKGQITSIRVVDQEIARLEQQLAIYRTARVAYARVLQEELNRIEPH